MLQMHRVLRAEQLARPDVVHDLHLLVCEIAFYFFEDGFRVRGALGCYIVVGGVGVGVIGGVVIDGALDLLQHGGALLGDDVFPGVGAEGDGFGKFGLGDAGGDVGGALDDCRGILSVGVFPLKINLAACCVRGE